MTVPGCAYTTMVIFSLMKDSYDEIRQAHGSRKKRDIFWRSTKKIVIYFAHDEKKKREKLNFFSSSFRFSYKG